MIQRLVPRYAAWVDARRTGILVLSLLIAVLGVLAALRLPLRSDLSSLLPESRDSVKDLRALQARANAFGKVFVMVEADDPAVREQAATRVQAGIARIDEQVGKDLVGYVTVDDGALYRFVWQHRFLYAELADLTAARDALAARLRRARARANPLYVELDEQAATAAARAEASRLSELRDKLAEAERRAARPPRAVSPDGRIQLITIDATFASSSSKLARELLDAVDAVLEQVGRELPGARFGVTGTVTLSLAEHDSVVGNTIAGGIVTFALCAVALVLYYRSRFVVLAIAWALVVGVIATLAVAWLAIGHLNIMSAFLIAIVIGNGINPGLILASRYLEEVHAGRPAAAAIGPAIAGALPGTLTAMLTAAIAYGSLVVSDFRGFRHFGVIAGIGMLLTWLAAFTVLPAALSALARRGRIPVRRPPGINRVLAGLMPRRGWVIACASAITVLGVVIAAGYLASDPFTRDWRELASSNARIRELRALDQKLADSIPSSSRFSGLSYQLVIGLPDRAQVPALIESLQAIDRGRPEAERLFLDVRSIADLLPRDQPAKLELLAELRRLMASDLIGQLDADEQELIARLRPPPDLRPLTDADLPHELAWRFIERDGSRGRLIAVRGAPRFRTWDVADREEFATAVRAIPLPPGAVIGGEPLVIADIVQTMERDTPVMIAVALIGSVLAVLLVLGVRRHAIVTIVCGLSGVAIMIAGCALIGLSVHFIDVIALPITIGIGVDYAANLAARDREAGSAREQVSAIAGAVILCSYTTTVAYGSLLLSANGGIRAFGIAAIVGELACIFTAMILAPALLTWLRERRARGVAPSSG